MQVAEGATQAVLVRGHDDGVNMIGHQTIGSDLGARLLRRVGQQIEIERIVAFLEENLLPPIAALGSHDAEGRERPDGEGGPWHELTQV